MEVPRRNRRGENPSASCIPHHPTHCARDICQRRVWTTDSRLTLAGALQSAQAYYSRIVTRRCCHCHHHQRAKPPVGPWAEFRTRCQRRPIAIPLRLLRASSISSETLCNHCHLTSFGRHVHRGRDPRDGFINLLKACNSMTSLLIAMVLYSAYWHSELLDRIHIHRGRSSHLNTKVTVMDILTKKTLWVEWVMCLVHVPPTLTDEFSTFSIGNIVTYRIEMVRPWST